MPYLFYVIPFNINLNGIPTWDKSCRALRMTRKCKVAQMGHRADGISRKWNVAHMGYCAKFKSREWYFNMVYKLLRKSKLSIYSKFHQKQICGSWIAVPSFPTFRQLWTLTRNERLKNWMLPPRAALGRKGCPEGLPLPNLKPHVLTEK